MGLALGWFGEEMVARVEDSFRAREQLGIASQSKLPWKWTPGANQQVVHHGVRDGELLNSFSSAASRSGELTAAGGCWGGSNEFIDSPAAATAHHNPSHTDSAGAGGALLNSFMSSYLMMATQSHQQQQQQQLQLQQQQQAVLTPGRAEGGVGNNSPPSLAPGSLARNPSFESISNTTGSCSTPSLCVGSPIMVIPSHPSDSAAKLFQPATESREVQLPHELSDHSFSTESLSYGGGHHHHNHQHQDHRDPHNIVHHGGGGDDFWIPHDMMNTDDAVLPDFRFEMILDDTADTGACCNAFPVTELDSLVVSGGTAPMRGEVVGGNHQHHHTNHMLQTSMMPSRGGGPAPDFCQSFFAGVDELENPTVAAATTTTTTTTAPINIGSGSSAKPTHIAIPPKHGVLAAFHNNTTSEQPGRLRWSDHPQQPWEGTCQYGSSKMLQAETSPVSLAGSTPSSPTTPLDPHLFASSLQQQQCPGSAGSTSNSHSQSTVLRAEEIQKKLTEFNNNSNNKRSFSAMQMGSSTNTDKFDAAALSALLYSNTQANQSFRSSLICKDAVAGGGIGAPPAPKQRRRHGTATDPQSIAARTRREKFTDRIRILQSLVPNGERLDTVHMLSQTFEYVRFLQHKVWDLYNGKDSIAEVKCEKWKEFMDSTTGQVIV